MLRHSLYFTGPRQVSLREESLSPPGPGQVLVQTILSAISPGTELLIYRGQAPRDLAADTSIAALAGSLAFPLKYGYAAVGRVVELGRDVAARWQGALVFAFHPHESAFLATPDELLPVPAGLDSGGRRVLAQHANRGHPGPGRQTPHRRKRGRLRPGHRRPALSRPSWPPSPWPAW